MTHLTFPAHGTWYSRYASLYTQVPEPTPELPAVVTALPALPHLTSAA